MINRISIFKSLGVSDETLGVLEQKKGNLFEAIKAIGCSLKSIWEEMIRETDPLKIARLNIKTETILLDLETFKTQIKIEKSLKKELKTSKENQKTNLKEAIDKVLGEEDRRKRWTDYLFIPQKEKEFQIEDIKDKKTNIEKEPEPDLENELS